MIYQVVVTAEDIKYGRPCDSADCPIARALNRLVPGSGVGYRDPTIGYVAWIGHPSRTSKHTILPKAAQEFARNFDQRLPVEPFEFALGG